MLVAMHTPTQPATPTPSAQPVKREESFKPAEVAPQTPSKEIKYDTNEKLTAPGEINPTAQKAGHEASENKLESKQEVKPSMTASQRLDQIRADLLGLSKNKLAVGESRHAQKSVQDLKLKTPAERLSHAQATLKEVNIQPNAVLERNHGLKRLMEELGLLHPRFAAKKIETANKAGHRTEIESADNKNNSKLGAQHATAKTGDGSKNQDQSSFNSSKDEGKYTKPANKIVSRETSLTPPSLASEPNGALGGKGEAGAKISQPIDPQRNDDFAPKPVVLTQRSMTELARANIDAPALSSMLRQQLDEIMSRAHIQIADTQNANFSVKLNPKDLGRVDLDLRLRDGELTGKIVVESEAVRQEMQNFLNDSNSNPDFKGDFRNIDVEVRPEQQNARENQREKNADPILPDLVTRNDASRETNPELSQRSTPVGIYA